MDPNPSKSFEEQSFEDFVHCTAGRALARAAMLTGRRQDAEDLVQEAYLAAHRAWERIRAEYDSPEAWLARVMANMWRAETAKRSRRAEALWRLPAPPQATTEETEQARAVLKAIGQLADQQRTALVLHTLYGLTYLEIAEQLGISPGTVGAHINKARTTLRKRLDIQPTRGAGRVRGRETSLVSAAALTALAGAGPAASDPIAERLAAAEHWLAGALAGSAATVGQRVQAATAMPTGAGPSTEDES